MTGLLPLFWTANKHRSRFKRDGGDIWWAGVRESKPLSDLQRVLHNRLAAGGFKLETRGFSPHITLGREVTTTLLPKQIEPFEENVDKIDLMRSDRKYGKLVYACL